MQYGQVSSYGIDNHGVLNTGDIHWNLSPPKLVEMAVLRGEGILAEGGPFVTVTAPYTGRSPNDKYTVKEPSTEENIWWGKVNVPIAEEVFKCLYRKVLAYFQHRDLFVRDAYCGADPDYHLKVRVVSERASASLFVYNMFVDPDPSEWSYFEPEFTLLHAPGLKADPGFDGTQSEAFVVVNFDKRIVLIGGTSYAGEIKKSIFSVMNYLMPFRGVFPMHCSANLGPKGDTALFFGLSGTGKTTLSADPKRALIGDDEHGWSPNGVFNFEQGCYAKVIRLSPTGEPDIYHTTGMFATLLENVIVDPESRKLDLDDGSITENTRASYPINYIPNIVPEGQAGHPQNVVFLTADAFGVLPPISRLTPEQAMYHFISGYTAKVAGTERGITEPMATFSACFGAPFLPLHPFKYADMLRDRMTAHKANVWLVNTGWTGGPYGVGHRMKLDYTRAMLTAALNGDLDDVEMEVDPIFGLAVPKTCPGVPDEVLVPRNTWVDKDAYDREAAKLAQMFHDNFQQFADEVPEAVVEAGPKVA
ncbi:MAG: phosphoenolpyruvate carboxykinase (ATP) [Chloroflexota bacterium]|nr:phosphoenolpyruvate carboxykinase (ATP) [Chloroflexota bacterium]